VENRLKLGKAPKMEKGVQKISVVSGFREEHFGHSFCVCCDHVSHVLVAYRWHIFFVDVIIVPGI